MDFNSILAVVINTFGKIENIIELDWIGNIIKWLIESSNSIGLGIILFTLILKLITLPFDIISRVSTKKNNVMMEKMRPELERLQRQFANNNELYQRKIQDLYKKNGYSPFSACLPTILNLVVFIIVIGQFSTYSNYANFGVFCNMSVAYENAIINYNQTNADGVEYIYTLTQTDENGNEETKTYLNVQNFVKYHGDVLTEEYGLTLTNVGEYEVTASFADEQKALKRIYEEIAKGKEGLLSVYAITDLSDSSAIAGAHIYLDGETYKYGGLAFDTEGNNVFKEGICAKVLNEYAQLFIDNNIKKAGSDAAAEVFRNTELSFLWVKNIWSQDLPWQHPVKENFSEYAFQKNSGCFAACSASCSGTNNSIETVTNDHYQQLTASLQEEKQTPNGYLILVVLSIGIMLVSQLVAQKQNKAQTELGSVDGANGSAAQTQKMMTWMMPIMFGFFSFMYTASFSIYIIVSSVFSMLSNFIINLFVDRKFARIAQEEARKLELKRTGRINEINNTNKKNKKK